MKKTILLYGLLGGVLIAGLKPVEYRFLVIEHSVEFYGGVIALLDSDGNPPTRRPASAVLPSAIPMDERQMAELLNREDVAGRIIKDVAVLDWLLGDVIAVYFTPDLPRYAAFSELVLSGMSFHQKIEVLKGLKLEKQYRCLAALHALQRFKKIRNLIAHRHYIGDRQVEKLLSDPAVVRMFSDWLVNYRSEVNSAKLRLRRLAITREFTRYEVQPRA